MAIRSRAVLAATFLLAASGCAFGNRNARLAYPPPAADPTASAGAATTPQPAAVPAVAPAQVTIALQRVTDARPEPRKVVGHVRNGLGMHTADVLTDDDVAAWVTYALRYELERLGVQVVGDQPGAPVPVLGAELSHVHCSAYFTYEGEVSIRAWVRAGSAYPVNQVYGGRGSSGMNWAATGEGYAECVARALQDAARKIAADATTAARATPREPGPATDRRM